MSTITHLGPSNVPCGTPPLGCPGGEICFPILTCWVVGFYPTGELQFTFEYEVASHTDLSLQVVCYG